ncbi:hypothetical protein H5410_021391 [Solanum commersonii]|uniref:Uncharacterized protein n=1 Tax=Solanum commersonii TaxID=4109 RepID=A0A9J5ZH25_SOLCO|nr:hypothetical protein H5410_021391 [Solanum commersonii]
MDSTKIIVQCPQHITLFSLNLRKEKEVVPTTVALNTLRTSKNTTTMEKGRTTGDSNHLPVMMNFIIWNARGTNSASFRLQCDSIVMFHIPALLVLLETNMIEHRNLTEEINFDTQIQIVSNGFSSGNVIMWKEQILNLDNISVTPQGIHVMDKAPEFPKLPSQHLPLKPRDQPPRKI